MLDASPNPTAVVTGASRGLGRALASALAARGWRVVIDARDATALDAAVDDIRRSAVDAAGAVDVVAVPGDVLDDGHRRALVATAGPRIEALVLNAAALGPGGEPALADVGVDDLEAVLRANAVAPVALLQRALPRLTPGAAVVAVTSDAAVERYAGWGAYGASKAALEALMGVAAVEHPGLRVLVVDPGDMATAMQADAAPALDLRDLPPPEASVPGLLALIEGAAPSGRYRARDVVPATAAVRL